MQCLPQCEERKTLSSAVTMMMQSPTEESQMSLNRDRGCSNFDSGVKEKSSSVKNVLLYIVVAMVVERGGRCRGRRGGRQVRHHHVRVRLWGRLRLRGRRPPAGGQQTRRARRGRSLRRGAAQRQLLQLQRAQRGAPAGVAVRAGPDALSSERAVSAAATPRGRVGAAGRRTPPGRARRAPPRGAGS